jgi:predicted O-methyltransferase YrrM
MSWLDTAVEVARNLAQLPDERPEWLKALPHANDQGAMYFRALYEWAHALQPKSILEIGTDRGWSAANIAAGALSSTVVTLDIRADSAGFVREFPVDNIVPITMNSSVAADHVVSFHPFDMLFVDGNHTFNQAYGEYVLYRPLMREGALILFDDLALDMDGDEMGVFWDHVLDRKERVDHLHHSGFGICEVSHGTQIPPWRAVIYEASRRIRG